MNHKIRIYFYLFIGILFLSVLYSIQTKIDQSVTDVNLVYRRIETPAKFLLNGYLGHFFNFKYLGCLNWLIIPFGIYAVFKLHFLDTRWKKAIALSYMLIFILISAKGYFNSRYQLTLMPITLPVAILFLWLYLKENNLIKYKFHIVFALFVLIKINNFLGVLFMEEKIGTNDLEQKGGIMYSLKHPIQTLSNLEKKTKSAPYPVIDFIRTLPKKEMILVNNLPMLYYYTDKKGVYYWCGDDTYYSNKGRSLLRKKRNFEQLNKFILDTLNCKYLLSTEFYNEHDTTWVRFVRTYCKPVFMDYAQFIVFKIEPEKGNYKLDDFKEVYKKKRELGLNRFSITEKDVEKNN
jgi:hypothetical protein